MKNRKINKIFYEFNTLEDCCKAVFKMVDKRLNNIHGIDINKQVRYDVLKYCDLLVVTFFVNSVFHSEFCFYIKDEFDEIVSAGVNKNGFKRELNISDAGKVFSERFGL